MNASSDYPQIQRHGARYPTSEVGQHIQKAVDKLKSAQNYSDPKLLFLRNYTYDLGENDLLPVGALESVKNWPVYQAPTLILVFDRSSSAGALQYERYSDLVTKDCLPFVRAAGGRRVVDSAGNWTAGIPTFHARTTTILTTRRLLSDQLQPRATASDTRKGMLLRLTLSKAHFMRIAQHSNNTLANNMCPKAGNADEQTNYWGNIFASRTAARLNKEAPGAGLAASDIPHLMSLCPFETLVKGVTSRFCDLFTEDDFQGFDYYQDLKKYYGYGYVGSFMSHQLAD